MRGHADADAAVEELKTSDLFAGYNAAVKILVTEQSPDWINPWQTRTAHRRMGSGTPLTHSLLLISLLL
jgi:hypothetical protein